jgi:hypothetical protein
VQRNRVLSESFEETRLAEQCDGYIARRGLIESFHCHCCGRCFLWLESDQRYQGGYRISSTAQLDQAVSYVVDDYRLVEVRDEDY